MGIYNNTPAVQATNDSFVCGLSFVVVFVTLSLVPTLHYNLSNSMLLTVTCDVM